MARSDIGSIVADAWDQIRTLSSFGTDPLTVGWWRGQAFVHLYDWRRGQMTWKAFETSRPEQAPRHTDPFTSTWLWEKFR